MVGSVFSSKLVWVLAFALMAALAVVKVLSNQNQALNQKNADLMVLVDKNVDENQKLVSQIEKMTLQKKLDQHNVEIWRDEYQKRKAALNQRVQQLEKEIQDAQCHDEPIVYPDDWMSGYESFNPIS